MCGICGVVEWQAAGGDAAAREQQISRMLDCLIHRGPDGLGVESRGPVTLGAVRLAIRGLEDGRQPIVDEEHGILAVCNGEIDNHLELKQWLASRGRIVSAATDVAVLPGLYLELGAAFIERLVGAFAIGLWSARDETLLLARDRAGERPLHVIVSERGVQFASELAALAAGAPEPLAADAEALRGYLTAGFFPAPHDPFRGVRRVAPGELLEIGRSGIRSRRYWRWHPGGLAGADDAAAARPVHKELAHKEQARKELGDEFDGIFRNAVKRQSEVDVPYGVFLSGGLDSSLVAAVLRRLRPEYKLAAYSLKFSEASYDESEHARRVAQALGVEFHCVEVGAETLPQTIAELVASSGEPLADPAWVPTALLARRAAHDVKIALVGEGADELFGGYPTYIGAGVYQRYARLPAWVRGAVRWSVERWPVADKKVTLSFLLKRFVQGEGLDAVARHLLWTSTISPQVMARLGVPLAEMRRANFAAATGDSATGAHVLDLLQRLDLENSLAEGLLTKADRASMRYAIELRAPYLDVDVMEFAARLPPKERVRGFQTKVFLKRFAARYLPSSIVHRRKRGLSVPLAQWLREPLYDWARARLSAAWLDAVGVKPGAAAELLEEHRARRADHSRALWTLIVLSEWIAWSESAARE